VLTLVVFGAWAATMVYLWYAHRARQRSLDRLESLVDAPAEMEVMREAPVRRIRPFPTRYRYLPPSLGILVTLVLWIPLGIPVEISVAAGVLVGVLSYLVEFQVAEAQAAKIEMQLAEAIDLLVGSLRAGASLLSAFDSALQESSAPLKPYLQEVAGRIRLGDDPRAAVTDLPVYVPLETFRLFATSLAIHWEVGGSLATTLTTVGRTVRDRIELGRRVRAQGVEANASVAVVLGLAYLLAILMWRTNPDRLEAFINTGLGTALVAGVMVLQSVGLIWMSRLSRPDF
jgi:tight adherence protein B